MDGWILVTVAAASAGILIVLVIVFIRRCCNSSKQHQDFVDTNKERANTLQTGIAKLHQIDLDNSKGKTNYYVFRRGVSARPLFSWSDNPSLVTDAVENGWSRFAFTSYTSSPSIRSTRSMLLGVCASGDHGRQMEVDLSWEVCQGSADFMQKVRLNSGLRKINTSNSSMTAISVIKTALPLPGPPLGNSSFPQEAYFEITILSSLEDDHEYSLGKVKVGKVEGEKTKLIQQNNSIAKSNSVTSSNGHHHHHHQHGNNKFEELKLGGMDDGKEEIVMLSLGLTGGGSLPLKLPGSYPGSIGFNSNGSVYLDGIKLVFESEKEEWGRADKVIGCGYNPSQKKVFFTVDSQLVRVIHCKSEEFGTPLYPTLAANTDIMVLVNFGQSVFKYAPANMQRTPNPCFIGPLANSPALGYEDSKELFSMGRIDSHWLNRSTTKSSHNNGTNNKAQEFDGEESEGDLFEIVLDSSGRSPNTVL
uniref:SPRY domain-containing protein n=1 Tax=Davidia involucrata TaxID=16924 RepID=A0A5B6Z4A9_DAVIN